MSLDVYLSIGEEEEVVYTSSITHNLRPMAEAAGVSMALWRPEEAAITTAEQLIQPLRTALERLRSDPAIYEPYNASNGWGKYENLVWFIEKYLAACEKTPHASVSVWR